MVGEANTAKGYPPLPLKTLTVPLRPTEPHNLSNTRLGGGPNEVWDHPDCKFYLSSSAHQHPIPQKMGL